MSVNVISKIIRYLIMSNNVCEKYTSIHTVNHIINTLFIYNFLLKTVSINSIASIKY